MLRAGRNGTMAGPDDEGHSGWRIDQIAGTADGTRVQLWTCNGTGAQQWTGLHTP
jgi:hypothetical protein